MWRGFDEKVKRSAPGDLNNAGTKHVGTLSFYRIRGTKAVTRSIVSKDGMDTYVAATVSPRPL